MDRIISINDAAELSNKSVQTIRRMIKSKKIKFKRRRTPQGFNYLIERDSVVQFFGLKDPEFDEANKDFQKLETELQNKTEKIEQEKRDMVISKELALFEDKIDAFNMTIQKLIDQNQQDKENFFHLIKTFQNRIGVLENNVRVLETTRTRSWFTFWKK